MSHTHSSGRRRSRGGRAAIAAAVTLLSPLPLHASAAAWSGYAHDPQHTAISPVASQNLQNIRWQTAVDLSPVYSGGLLYAHYGSALFTPANTAIVPVKTGSSGGFKVEGRAGATGTLLWSQTSSYVLPPHNWVPPFAPTITSDNRLYMPEIGGQVTFRNSVDSAGAVSTGQTAFFGNANYALNPSGYNSSVFINTPITSDASGNIYFGYTVSGSSPLAALGTGGVARISSTGVGTFVKASTVGGSFVRPAPNCAPALSNDGSTLYIALSTSSATGSLVALNASTLGTVAQVPLIDPNNSGAATLHPDGTSAVTVGPDGKVFYGVLENSLGSHNYRGWMTQFTSSLGSTGHPDGSFGWDITPSIVPASMVPSYTGSSQYLLATKYNNYIGLGDGVNKLAILDPNASQADPITPSVSVMKEVLTIAGVTPDGSPPAVREWCINTAAVDPATHSILANSEDGKLYRWDTNTNSFTQSVTLTSGIGEAYTPTLVAPDGTVYAVNNAQLFAVGTNVSTWNKNDSVSVWSSPSSWTGTGGVPSGVGATANFSSVITAPRTVNIDSPRTVGTINFENPNAYTLAGSTITLENNVGTGAWVNVISGSHNIAAPLALNSDTTFNVIPANQTLKVSDLTADGRAITKYGDGVLEVNHIHANSLAVNAGRVKITPAADPTNVSSYGSVSVIPNLTIASGAQLDLSNAKLVTNLPPEAVAAMIASGRNGGAWNGTGLITSQPAAATSNLTTLGMGTAGDIGFSDTALWAGSTVSSDETLVMYTYGGDATLDGKINIDDYVRIDTGISASLTGWSNGDFNYDGKVNIDDYTTIIDVNIINQNGVFATSGGAESSGITAIPEPAAGTATLLAAALSTCRRRRRRRRNHTADN